MAATAGDTMRVFQACRMDLARYPPIYPRPSTRWPQEAVVQAFKQVFPDRYFEDFNFPFIEDMVNAPPFTA